MGRLLWVSLKQTLVAAKRCCSSGSAILIMPAIVSFLTPLLCNFASMAFPVEFILIAERGEIGHCY